LLASVEQFDLVRGVDLINNPLRIDRSFTHPLWLSPRHLHVQLNNLARRKKEALKNCIKLWFIGIFSSNGHDSKNLDARYFAIWNRMERWALVVASCYLEAMGSLISPPCKLKESLAVFIDDTIGLTTKKLVSKWPSKRVN
jgi:hypothetical protein